MEIETEGKAMNLPLQSTEVAITRLRNIVETYADESGIQALRHVVRDVEFIDDIMEYVAKTSGRTMKQFQYDLASLARI